MASLFWFAACDETARPPAVPNLAPDTGPVAAECSTRAEILCEGVVETVCNESGEVSSVRSCAADGEVCVGGLGCRTCSPRSLSCQGDRVRSCSEDGMSYQLGDECDVAAGERCSPEGCRNLCAEAEASHSYIGCEYWATPTYNPELDVSFTFGVALSNPQLVEASVRIEQDGKTVAERVVAPNAVELVALPWVGELRGAVGRSPTMRVDAGAYHVFSDVPVTAHQFNPVEFVSSRGEYSFTNDASLLLPVHALTGNYVVVSRPTHFVTTTGTGVTSGFVTLVGAADGVNVQVRARSGTLASDGLDVPAVERGGLLEIRLDKGDVLQLASDAPATCPPGSEDRRDVASGVTYCDLGSAYDLTGSTIAADGPVAVIAGHGCSFVPFNRWACDHLEESLLPLEAWGKHYVLAQTNGTRDEPNLVRVLSAVDDNVIVVSDGQQLMLDANEYVEFEFRDGLELTAEHPFVAAQFMVGQEYAGLGTSGNAASGDPSMSFAIPLEQWRGDYSVLSPSTYRENYIHVFLRKGATVLLDGVATDGYIDIPGTEYWQRALAVRAGAHRISASSPVGVMVYGQAPYTSYLYPGGMNLTRIFEPPR